MSKFVVSIESNLPWNIDDIKGNIEQEFPGWKVNWLSYVTDFLDKQLVAEVASESRLEEPWRPDEW